MKSWKKCKYNFLPKKSVPGGLHLLLQIHMVKSKKVGHSINHSKKPTFVLIFLLPDFSCNFTVFFAESKACQKSFLFTLNPNGIKLDGGKTSGNLSPRKSLSIHYNSVLISSQGSIKLTK